MFKIKGKIKTAARLKSTGAAVFAMNYSIVISLGCSIAFGTSFGT